MKMDSNNWIVLVAFIFIAGMLILTGINSFTQKDKQETIKFEVIGITNSVNATTLVSLHYECIKYCMNKFYDDGMKLSECYKQCATLGKEECLG